MTSRTLLQLHARRAILTCRVTQLNLGRAGPHRALSLANAPSRTQPSNSVIPNTRNAQVLAPIRIAPPPTAPASRRLVHVPSTGKKELVFALESKAELAMQGSYFDEVKTLSPEDLLARALEQTEQLMLFFILMCKGDEDYMRRFDAETDVSPTSDMGRTRAATAKLLKAIAWDVRHVPATHISRTEDEILDMQITEIAEVADRQLKDGQPENWQSFWDEIYLLYHGLGSSLAKWTEKQEAKATST